MSKVPDRPRMTHATPATVDPTMTLVWALGFGVALALLVAEGPVAVGCNEDTLALEDSGGRHPSIE